MKSGVLFAITALFMSLAVTTGSSAATVKSTFTFVNEDAFPGIRIFVKRGTLGSREEIPAVGNLWSYDYTHPEDRWISQLEFIFEFDYTSLTANFDRVSFSLPFRLRKSVSYSSTIPVYAMRAPSPREADRIDGMRRDDELFNAFFLSAQMAKQLAGSGGLRTDDFTRRVTQKWFDTLSQIVKLTHHESDLPFAEIDSEVLETAISTVEGKAARIAYFRKSYDDLASLFWLETNEVPLLARTGRCEDARLLLKYVERQHQISPHLAAIQLQYVTPEEYMASRWAIVTSACPES